jgi:hypothetical protein
VNCQLAIAILAVKLARKAAATVGNDVQALETKSMAVKSFLRRILRALRHPHNVAKVLRYRHARWNDFRLFRDGLQPYSKFVGETPPRGGLLIVAGMGMNVTWAQLWSLLSIPAMRKGYKPYVLLTASSRYLLRYFAILKIQVVDLEHFMGEFPREMFPDLADEFERAESFSDFKDVRWGSVPIGEIALSTYCRHTGRALVDVDDLAVRKELYAWVIHVCRGFMAAEKIFHTFDIRAAYFTETFMEEYGGIYYAALERRLNVLRFAGTVRDDAIIVQHRNWHSERLHHAALDSSSWRVVCDDPDLASIENQLDQNFQDRYGDKWHRSKRNQPNTQVLPVPGARAQLGIAAERKTAVVYSHILYDTIFFFGTDLFKDYATWLLETVRVAMANDRLEWFIKVHPSNIWRGEANELLGGRYQEETLIEAHIGKLPAHVHIVPADTKISPLSWMKLADFGITVRGTSGLEMAALGKTVITAGTGRYEGCGFTIDPSSKEEYLALLGKLPHIPELTPAQKELARRYAHSIFLLKPFVLTSVEPRIVTGKTKVVASDDIVYVPRPPLSSQLPKDLAEFEEFLDDVARIDLLTHKN